MRQGRTRRANPDIRRWAQRAVATVRGFPSGKAAWTEVLAAGLVPALPEMQFAVAGPAAALPHRALHTPSKQPG